MSSYPSIGYVFDDRYLQHNPGPRELRATGEPYPFVDPIMHPSNYRLAMRSKHLIDLSGLGKELTRIDPFMAGEDDLTVYHSREYVDRVKDICARGGGDVGEGAPASRDSFEIALLAVGGAMAAVDAVIKGRVRRIFANIRPPGHHAMSDRGMGFCLFNNVVIAAHHARRKHGVQRVMILDWDVHSGNGTQDAFYGDPNVLFVSLHQDRLYPPEFGHLDQLGTGEGAGYTLNLPLPAGSGDAAYLAAFERVVLPIADAFQPELVLVSAGQDASVMDELGRMCVTTEGYRRMTRHMIDLAERHAGGRLVVLQEGGYSETYAPYCTLAVVETLADRRMGLGEPLSEERLQVMPHYAEVGASAEEALAAIRDQYAGYWPVLQSG